MPEPDAVAEIQAPIEKYFRRIFENENALLRKEKGELKHTHAYRNEMGFAHMYMESDSEWARQPGRSSISKEIYEFIKVVIMCFVEAQLRPMSQKRTYHG